MSTQYLQKSNSLLPTEQPPSLKIAICPSSICHNLVVYEIDLQVETTVALTIMLFAMYKGHLFSILSPQQEHSLRFS